MNYSITNIVAKTKTQEAALNEVTRRLEASGVSFKRTPSFPAVFLKLSEGTCTIFSTGTVTLNGCKSLEEIGVLKERFEAIFDVGLSTPEVVNIVLKLTLGGNVDLQKLGSQPFAFYEPELSNSVNLRLPNHVNALVHGTGSGIVTGIRSMETIDTIIEMIRSLIIP